MPIKASAPGSMMMLGEYAVLHGKRALVCAVDKRMTVTLTPNEDESIQIESALGRHETTLATLTVEKPFQFVLGALHYYQPKLRRGCHIKIESEFSDQVGFGSSAAVTVATLAALVTWMGIRVSPLELMRHGCRVIKQVQGIGSGADIAASVLGGMVNYQAHPLSAEKFSMTYPITALYTGFKTPTVDAIKQVQQNFTAHPAIFRHLMDGLGQCAAEGIQFLRREEWTKLGEVMNMQQGMMESLGVSLPIIRDMVCFLREEPSMLGAKISGSGLGDCVIGLGELKDPSATMPGMPLSVAMTLQGVQCEKI